MSVRLSISQIKTYFGFWRIRSPVEQYIVNDVTYHRYYVSTESGQPIISFRNEYDMPQTNDDSVRESALESIINDYSFFDVDSKLFKKRWSNGQLIFDRFYRDAGSINPSDHPPMLTVYPSLVFHKFGENFDLIDAMRGVDAFDSIDGSLTNEIEVSGLLPGYSVGDHQLGYSVTNSRGITSRATRTLSVYVQQESITRLACGYLQFNVESSYFLDYDEGGVLSDEDEEDIRSDDTNFWLTTEDLQSLSTENIIDPTKDSLPIETVGDARLIPFTITTESGHTLRLNNANFATYEIYRYAGPNHNSGFIGSPDLSLTYWREDQSNLKYHSEEVTIKNVPEGYYNVLFRSYRNKQQVSSRFLYNTYAYVPGCDYSLEISDDQCGDLNFHLGESVLKDSHAFADGEYAIFTIYGGSPFSYIRDDDVEVDTNNYTDDVEDCLKLDDKNDNYEDSNECLRTEPVDSELEPEGFYLSRAGIPTLECLLTENMQKIDVAEDYVSSDECIEHASRDTAIFYQTSNDTIIGEEVEVEIDISESISTEDCRFVFINEEEVLEIQGETFAIECLYGEQENPDPNADVIREAAQIGALTSYPLYTESFQVISVSNDQDLEIQGSQEIIELETEKGFYINHDETTIAIDRQYNTNSLQAETDDPLNFEIENFSQGDLVPEYVDHIYRSGRIYESDFFHSLPAGRYECSVEIFDSSDRPILLFSSDGRQYEVTDCSCIQIEEGFCLTHGSDDQSLFLDFNPVSELESVFSPDPCGLTIEEDFGVYTDFNDLEEGLFIRTERGEVLYIAGQAPCIGFQLEEEAQQVLTSAYLNALSASQICETTPFELEGPRNLGLGSLSVGFDENLFPDVRELGITTEACAPLLHRVDLYSYDQLEFEFA